MRFFFDRNLSFRLARMLDAFELDHTVRHHDDRFEKHTADVEWIAALHADLAEGEPWIVVSGDARMLQRERERVAIRDSDLTFFTLAKGWLNIPLEVQAWQLVRIWPSIVAEARQQRLPTVYEVRLKANKVMPLGAARTFKKR